MDTSFSMALQCQVRDAFSATQDTADESAGLNIITVCAIILWPIFFSLFSIVKLSDIRLLNYLATTFLNLVTVFSLKVGKWRRGIFFSISSPADLTIRARR